MAAAHPLRLARNQGGEALAEAWEGVRKAPLLAKDARNGAPGYPNRTYHVLPTEHHISLARFPSGELTCGARKSDHRSESYVR